MNEQRCPSPTESGQPAPRGVVLGVFLLALAVLALEVLWTRLFSFSIWYHFAYLAINAALLGFGASGSVCAVAPRWTQHPQTATVGALLSGISSVVVLLVFARRPLEPQLAFDQPWSFAGSLALYYLGVSLPFFLAGLALASSLSRFSGGFGRLYGWDLLGAGLGAFAALWSIGQFGAPAAILLCASLLVLSAACFAWPTRRRWGLALAGLALVGSGLALFFGSRVTVIPAASTYVAEVYQKPWELELLVTRWNAINRIDVFASRDLNDTYAQWATDGISPHFQGPIPPVYHLIYDAHNRSDIYRFDGSLEAFAFLGHHLFRSPYVVKPAKDVLVIGSGGGIDVMNALYHGAESVTAVELQPTVVELLEGRFGPWVGHLYRSDSRVRLVAAEGRNFVERDPHQYDLIQFTATDTWSALNTGAYVLMESYLYTREAMSAYFDRLRPDGVLCLLVWDLIQEQGEYLQPINSRLIVQYLELLESRGVARPQDHLFVLGKEETYRNIFTVPLLKRSPFTDEERRRLRAFAEEMGFRVLFDPGAENEDNTLSRLLAASAEERQRLIESSFYNIRSTSDDSPFFFNGYRWSRLFGDPRFRWDAPMSGQLVLLMLLIQSVVLAGLVILLPLRLLPRASGRAGTWPFLAYGSALGLGFMLLEISFIQRFVLLVGYPAHAFAATVGSLLVFSGVGSLLSRRWLRQPLILLPRLFLALALLVLVYLLALPLLFESLVGAALAWRVAVAALAQAPLGLVLGMFLPLGIELARQRDPRLVPWIWGVNGVTSVAGTVLAIFLAQSFGFVAVSVLALVIYGLGVGCLRCASGVSRLPTEQGSHGG